MKIFKNILVALILVVGTCQVLSAQDIDSEYVKVTNERAQKIVDGMTLNDAKKELVVRDLIANQYRSLNQIHEGRDADIEKIKASGLTEEKQNGKIESVKAAAEKKVDKLHKSYIKGLSKELSADQVDAVKDGMTYGVFPKTYTSYLDMIPSLKEDEKKYIYDNLKEAREYAMDGGSSHEKHWWFGKYKGRINNYLSDRGYDLEKEREGWYKRIESAKKDK